MLGPLSASAAAGSAAICADRVAARVKRGDGAAEFLPENLPRPLGILGVTRVVAVALAVLALARAHLVRVASARVLAAAVRGVARLVAPLARGRRFACNPEP